MLIALILVPLLGAAISALLNRASAVARVVAVSTTVVTAVLAVLVWNSYRVAGDALTYALTGTGPGSFVTLAADGIAIPLVALTALLGFVAVVVSWDAERPGSCFALLLALEAAVMAVFLAADLILFYVAWEAVLIPMFFLIGGWGHDNRRYAAMKFFIYTFVGSAFMLLGLVFMVLAQSGGHAMPAAGALRLGDHEGLVFLLLAVGFVVKIPVVPFHTWLPDAHVEAPTAGSIMLAGVLLKMGAYGFIRFCIPYTPEAFAKAAPLLGALGLAGIVYGAVVALGQSDLKRLVAYSSVAHMGFVVLGLASRTTLGVQGAILGMVSHGLVAALLFLLVGALHDRTHTREISAFGGLGQTLPRWAGVFVFASLASLGLPGLSGFPGEFAAVAGSFVRWGWPIALAGVGVVGAGVYALHAVRGVVQGEPAAAEEGAAPLPDLGVRELLAVAPLAVLIVLLGLWPRLVTDVAGPAVDVLAAALGGWL